MLGSRPTDRICLRQRPAQQWAESPTRGNDDGHSTFQVNSPPYGAPITYRLPADVPTGDVRVVVSNAAGRHPGDAAWSGDRGDVHRELELPTAAGPRPAGPTSAVDAPRQHSPRCARAVRVRLVDQGGFDTVSIQRARELLGANTPKVVAEPAAGVPAVEGVVAAEAEAEVRASRRRASGPHAVGRVLPASRRRSDSGPARRTRAVHRVRSSSTTPIQKRY
jgi:hypothetical protein